MKIADISNSQPIAIIGAQGFIGKRLCAQLEASGSDYWVVDHRMNPNLPPYQQSRARNALAGLEESLVGASTMVYLASASTPYLSEQRPDLETQNIKQALAYFTAAIASGIKRIVFLSSGGTVYGESDDAIFESATTKPSCFYGVGKLAIEGVLRRFIERGDISGCILRVANVYGPSQTSNGAQGLIPAILNAGKLQKKLTLYGNCTRDYIFLDDVCNAIQLALPPDSTDAEILNISTGIGTTNLEILNLASEFLEKEVEYDILEPRQFDLASIVLSNQLAKQELGWQLETGLRDGIRQTVSGFDSN